MAIEAANASDTRRTRGAVLLTDKLVRETQSGERTSFIVYDAKVKGFGIRVQASGQRSFVFNYVTAGRERRMTIGGYPAWSVAAAREHAAKLRRDVDAGGDPLGEREKSRNAPSLRDFWPRYRDEVSAKKRPSTHKSEVSVWERLILPALGHRKLEDISHSDIDRLHADISDTTPVQANRVLATLRHTFNMAKRWGIVVNNPVVGTRRNPEEGRERFLTAVELQALVGALESKGQSPAALALRFIIATGCRKSEALNAPWTQIDLAAGVWTKPSSHTKQKRLHRVPLGSEAKRVLIEAQALAGNPFVFPGKTGRALVEIKKTFHSACKEAGIEELRINDLRHTFASHLASAGTSLPIVGALLGHTQTATTARYAHLLDQPLRDATEILSAAMTRKDDE